MFSVTWFIGMMPLANHKWWLTKKDYTCCQIVHGRVTILLPSAMSATSNAGDTQTTRRRLVSTLSTPETVSNQTSQFTAAVHTASLLFTTCGLILREKKYRVKQTVLRKRALLWNRASPVCSLVVAIAAARGEP